MTFAGWARYGCIVFFSDSSAPIDEYLREVRTRLTAVLPADLLEVELTRLANTLQSMAAQIAKSEDLSRMESEARAVMKFDGQCQLPRIILKRYNPLIGPIRVRTWMAIGYLMGVIGFCLMPAWSYYFRSSAYHWASAAVALIGFGAVGWLAFKFRIVAGRALAWAGAGVFFLLVLSAPWVSAYGEFGNGVQFRWVFAEQDLANRHVITMIKLIDRQVEVLRQGKMEFEKDGPPTNQAPWYLAPGESPGSLERFGFNAVSYDDNNNRPRWVAPAYWFTFRYFGVPRLDRDVEYYAFPSYYQAKKRWKSASETFENSYSLQRASLQQELLMTPSAAKPDFGRIFQSMPYFGITALASVVQLGIIALMARLIAIMYRPQGSQI